MGSKQLVLMALTLVPIPFRIVRPLGVLAPLCVLPESRATAAGNKRNCQQPPDYLNAVFPRLGNHILFFYRASRSSSSQLGKAGSNGDRYWRFMVISGDQCRRLRSSGGFRGNPLKSLDEYNYCKYTKGWLS